ncbi:helix-turn-helix transcriptional regulator [Streptomyces sp. MBT62]|uniref:helix-turn-helix transcriptional regulator n=1 Tax=Streptomyces sp. MBT62 TaxID=2800410 RepID=UPI001F2239E3|nr:LuxR C-terminal-related transcriptional regulator [Streptomyces sp. MBT62]
MTGNSTLGYAGAFLQVRRGDDARVADRIDDRVREAVPWGEGRAIGQAHYVIAVLDNGLGRYEDALARAEQAWEYEELAGFGFTLFELVEAGARSEAPEAAAAALRRFEEQAGAAGTNWALGVMARSRALLGDGQEAELLYRQAIEHLRRSRVAVHRARTHLVDGEWLRRENRRIDAREQLRVAYDMLSGFGAELFISPRTVEWHLHKVFTKLDVTSRNKLRAAPARD